MELVDALNARDSPLCTVGAGGKKSTLYALAARLERAVITSTVRIPPFESHVADFQVTEGPVAAIDTETNWPVGVVRSREPSDRYCGYEPQTVEALCEAVADDVSVLVKADGARARWFKAPGAAEPQLPATAAVVVPVVSVRVVGKRLNAEHVHRPERVAALTDLEVGDRITAGDVATVITNQQGGWKDVPETATVIPLLNMVDTPALAETGRRIAREVHRRRAVRRVVLSCLRTEQPVVDVI